MAERQLNVFGNPVIVGLLAIVILVMLAAGGTIYLGIEREKQVQGFVGEALSLGALAQEVAKHAEAAAQGNAVALSSLGEARARTDEVFINLREGNARTGVPRAGPEIAPDIAALEDQWLAMSAHVDVILANGQANKTLREIASDITISMAAIQQQNSRLVAILLREGSAASEITRAQHQALLIERMSRGIDRAVDFGGTPNMSDNFNRDSATFRSVLDGLMNGNRELLLTAVKDDEALATLTRMHELFRTVTSRVSEVLARSGEVTRLRASSDQLYSISQNVPAAAKALADAGARPAPLNPASPWVTLGLGGVAVLLFLVTLTLVIRQARRNMGASAVENEQNQAAILQLLDELAALADGDLTVQATVTESFTGAIADSINFTIDQLRALVSKINETSGHVSSAADATRASVDRLSKASERQASEISDVSMAVSEMAISIDKVSYNAAESSSVAERSVEIANKGVITVQNTIGGMDKIRGQIQETAKRIKRLGESSQEIGDIVLLINDIADQTNILSLNAAIQASMAGDAGKGFAVVADEVQRLAERSGAAAKQISALVKTIQGDTNEAVSSMEQTTAEVVQGTRLTQEAGVALEEIEGVSTSLAEIIENISDAARQQAASAGKISNTMKSIQEITSQTTEGTRSTANSVGDLAEITNELQLSVTGFKLP